MISFSDKNSTSKSNRIVLITAEGSYWV